MPGTDGRYDELEAEGYGYGPAFRGLRNGWRRGEEVFAEIALPGEGGDPGAFGIHPALLDAVRGRGQAVSARAKSDPALPRGYWGAIATAATPPRYRGARTFGWGPVRGLLN